MSTPLTPWSVTAVNLAAHADNPVHTVEGGRAAGYAGAVVAGTTIYAYLTRPAVAAWGADWVGGGAAEVRFQAPVLADEDVAVVPSQDEDGDWVIEALGPAGRCATLAVGLSAEAPPDATGERLEPLVEVLDEYWTDYPDRIGDDLPLYAEQGIVHPVVWPALANRLFSAQLVEGSWVHTRSHVRHLATAAPGTTAIVEGWLVDRFTTRAGDRAVVDVRISVDDRPVVAIEHEAIVRLAG